MAIKSFPLYFESATSLSSRVKHFVFKANSQDFHQFIPGQFITLLIEHEGKLLRRSYSLANQSQNGKVEFAASYVPHGIASELLFNLNSNDQIEAQGPFGRLISNDADIGKRLILVGTSTGITPYLAMLEQLSLKLDTGELSDVIIIQGVSHHKELLYEQEFLSFANSNPQAQFFAAISREQQSDLPTHCVQGRVQAVLETLQLSADNDVIYLCGNPHMIDDVFERLKQQDFETKQIRREKYISR